VKPVVSYALTQQGTMDTVGLRLGAGPSSVLRLSNSEHVDTAYLLSELIQLGLTAEGRTAGS
jgi:hypothetical protein